MGLDITAHSGLTLYKECANLEEADAAYNEDNYASYVVWEKQHPGGTWEDWAATCNNKVEPWNPRRRMWVGEPDGCFVNHLGVLVRPYCVYTYKQAYGFRAGSYSGYNNWREALSVLGIGVLPCDVWGDWSYENRPFYYLVNFSDCEGAIGMEYSAKLYQDFLAQEPIIRAKFKTLEIVELVEQFPQVSWLKTLEERAWFWEKYRDWKRAFRLAKNNGVVVFH